MQWTVRRKRHAGNSGAYSANLAKQAQILRTRLNCRAVESRQANGKDGAMGVLGVHLVTGATMRSIATTSTRNMPSRSCRI
jgi:hypothetical protein